MTNCTVVVKLPLGMAWVIDRLEIVIMTVEASARQVRVLSSDMAFNTIHGLVSAQQREIGSRMVKCRRSPCIHRMTDCAVVIKLLLRVARVVDRLEVIVVTVETSSRQV